MGLRSKGNHMRTMLRSPELVLGFFADYLRNGRTSEEFALKINMREVSPAIQDECYRDDSFRPRHDTYLEKLVAVHNLILEERPKRVLELGVKHGFSTYAILSALNCLGPSYTLISIDRSPWAISGRETGHVVPEELRKNWILRTGEADDLLPSLGKFDFVYEDLGTDLDPKLLPKLWDSMTESGCLFIAARTQESERDKFAREKGGWFRKAEGTKMPIASWGVLRKD